MTDVFQEVDQTLREERLATLWKRWQWVVYGGVALAIGTVATIEIMRSMRAGEIAKSAKIYDEAFVAGEAGDLATARARFTELQTDKTGFAVIANHMLAGVEKQLTNDPVAIEGYLKQAAAADTGVMGDLAILKLGYLSADTVPLADLEATLKPLLDKDTQATRLARELVAAKALATGDVERARDLFEQLKLDLTVPQAMRIRVEQALATLPARNVNLDAPAAPAQPAAPAAAAPAETTPAPSNPAPSPPVQPQQAPQ